MTRERGNCGGIFDFDSKQTRLAIVSRELENPDIWQDAKRAQDLGREKKQLEGIVASLSGIGSRLRDAADLFALARDENDEETLIAIEADVAAVGKVVADLEFQRMFSNPADPNNCFLDIQS